MSGPEVVEALRNGIEGKNKPEPSSPVPRNAVLDGVSKTCLKLIRGSITPIHVMVSGSLGIAPLTKEVLSALAVSSKTTPVLSPSVRLSEAGEDGTPIPRKGGLSTLTESGVIAVR